MPKKCESCRHYRQDPSKPGFDFGFCFSPQIKIPMHSLPVLRAREICDREGDGIFVYFEPREPASGCAVAETKTMEAAA